MNNTPNAPLFWPTSVPAPAAASPDDGRASILRRGVTMTTGSKIPASAFVPTENPPNPRDELSGFRLAQSSDGPGCFFAARVKVLTPLFQPDELVIFDWEKEPKDGDLVCAAAFTQERPETRLTLALEWLAERAIRVEHLRTRLSLPHKVPIQRAYLLRRYVSDGADFRLEILDGTALAVTNTPLVDVSVCGVATPIRPFGCHRDIVMF